MASPIRDIKVTTEVAAEHGLALGEYERIREILGREPNITELGIFSVMWSEHCSYKSSKAHLRRLPTHGPQVLQGPGENAGVVDIGDGWCAAFKIESHNHPSFVEPFQGAATGVGGILRDIFTMGARPIAVMNSLRFGPIAADPSGAEAPSSKASPDVAAEAATHKPVAAATQNPEQGGFVGRGISPAEQPAFPHPSRGASAPEASDEIKKNRRILDGVVRGIAHYGNCFGVATVGGEVQFEPCYAHNPLVNALALGVARKDELFFARARGEGNPVIYAGAKTGRDGIHGASLLASAEFTEESQQKRPNVQVGDPFMEKLLLEACLEAMHTGAVVAIQDMGAAGLTCSTCEMASRGGTGIEIDLAKVPQRETGMSPYEIMLSESQERMLLVAERGREQQVFEVFRKWGLDAVEIGRVTGDGILRVRDHGDVAAEIPAHPLAEEGPVYQRTLAAPAAREDSRLVEFAPEGKDLTENFGRLLAAPAIASKRWIFEQYDHMVRTNTLVGPGAGDAAVVRVKGAGRSLALATDCNARWCQLDPRLGAMHAVAEAARNVACSGARPWAATNCLNFGSPEKPEVMWQFSEAIDGMAEACRALHVPITGGNVSFYNETLGKSVYPTPVVGILGVLEDSAGRGALGMGFQREGDVILILRGHGRGAAAGTGGEWAREFSSSEYARTIHGVVAGTPPSLDLEAEKCLIDFLVAAAGSGLLHSAHDISDGGLGVTLAESCFASQGFSAEVALEGTAPAEAALFGEWSAQAVVSVDPLQVAALDLLAAQYSVEAREIGRVTRGGQFRIECNGAPAVNAPLESLRDAWANSLERNLGM